MRRVLHIARQARKVHTRIKGELCGWSEGSLNQDHPGGYARRPLHGGFAVTAVTPLGGWVMSEYGDRA